MKTLNEQFFENKSKREALVGKYAIALNERDWNSIKSLKVEMQELKDDLNRICKEAQESEDKKTV